LGIGVLPDYGLGPRLGAGQGGGSLGAGAGQLGLELAGFVLGGGGLCIPALYGLGAGAGHAIGPALGKRCVTFQKPPAAGGGIRNRLRADQHVEALLHRQRAGLCLGHLVAQPVPLPQNTGQPKAGRDHHCQPAQGTKYLAAHHGAGSSAPLAASAARGTPAQSTSLLPRITRPSSGLPAAGR
jgi:hypothetical protein